MTKAPLFLMLLLSLSMLPLQAHTTLTVRGASQVDPYDRIVSLTYQGVEVARYITPLHRNGSLPDSFTWTPTLPFSAPASAFQATLTLTRPYGWAFTMAGPLTFYSSQVVGVVATFRAWTERSYNFTTPFAGFVYFIASGHSLCEAENGLYLFVDGAKAGHVYNWHPQSINGGDIPGVGIPYLRVDLGAGQHQLSFSSCVSSEAEPYVLTSAFMVEGANN